MAPQNQPENKPSPAEITPPKTSCIKKRSEEATFLEGLKGQFDEFIHASMDEHKACFKNTMKKMFDMTKSIAKRNADTKEAETPLPLQTTTSK